MQSFLAKTFIISTSIKCRCWDGYSLLPMNSIYYFFCYELSSGGVLGWNCVESAYWIDIYLTRFAPPRKDLRIFKLLFFFFLSFLWITVIIYKIFHNNYRSKSHIIPNSAKETPIKTLIGWSDIWYYVGKSDSLPYTLNSFKVNIQFSW